MQLTLELDLIIILLITMEKTLKIIITRYKNMEQTTTL